MSSSLLSLIFFQISGIFPNCFGRSFPANTTNKKLLNYINFTILFLCNSQSIETKLETFETETSKNGSRDESRDRNQVSRLHHWWLHICISVLQQSYPVSNYYPMKNKNKFRIDRVEIWTKLIVKTFITGEFNVFCLYFCFIFIFLSRN